MIDNFESNELIIFAMKCDSTFFLQWMNDIVCRDDSIIVLIVMKRKKKLESLVVR